MSTDRGWSTCLDLKDERYNKDHIHHLKRFLQSGYLIAYLIRKDDRNINNPISRVFIQKYNFEYRKDYATYGTYIREFDELIREWSEIHTSYRNKNQNIFKEKFDKFLKKYN